MMVPKASSTRKTLGQLVTGKTVSGTLHPGKIVPEMFGGPSNGGLAPGGLTEQAGIVLSCVVETVLRENRNQF